MIRTIVKNWPISMILLISLGLSGCLYKVVTVPVGLAYKTTKVVVKGTALAVGAVIPDSDDAETKSSK